MRRARIRLERALLGVVAAVAARVLERRLASKHVDEQRNR
jgi:hypothetical protein